MGAHCVQEHAWVPLRDLTSTALCAAAGQQPGHIQMRGADFSWHSRAWAGMPDAHASNSGGAASDMASSKSGGSLPSSGQAQVGPQHDKDKDAAQDGSVTPGSEKSGGGSRSANKTWPSRQRNLAQAAPRAVDDAKDQAGSRRHPGTAAGKPELQTAIVMDAAASVTTAQQAATGNSADPNGNTNAGTMPRSPHAHPQTMLRAPTFTIEPGQLVGVCGEVGSGKSSLLAALLGELQPIPPRGYQAGKAIAGAPVVTGGVAYCAQAPWIQAGTARDNVLFGCAYDAERCAFAALCAGQCVLTDACQRDVLPQLLPCYLPRARTHQISLTTTECGHHGKVH